MFNLISPPSLSFSGKKYLDENGKVCQEQMYNGDPSYKRKWLEEHRPVDWWEEWLKTQDLRYVGNDENLLRGGRIRYFNGKVEDIMAEEVNKG